MPVDTPFLATAIVMAFQVYALTGLLLAIYWVVSGLARFDSAAAEIGWGPKLLLIPGLAALWPLFLSRQLGGRGVPEERNAHRDAATAAATTPPASAEEAK